MKTALLCMLLMPPSITEIQDTEQKRIEYHIPNGFGINDIIISVPEGKEDEGYLRAEELYSLMHDAHELFYTSYFYYPVSLPVECIEIKVKKYGFRHEVPMVVKFLKGLGYKAPFDLSFEPKLPIDHKYYVDGMTFKAMKILHKQVILKYLNDLTKSN